VESLSPQTDQPKARLKLQARKGWKAIDLAEVWQYRELLWILAQRDIKVRYKQSILGILWAIIPPLFNMLIFTFIFMIVLKVDTNTVSEGLPYPIFNFVGNVPWALFAGCLSSMGNSMVSNQQLITKVYFPRLVIPFSAVLSCLVDFAVAMLILFIMMGWYHSSIHIGWQILLTPLFILLAVLSAVSVGIWLAALNVEFRDIRFVIPILIQLWMYASPVMYSAHRLPAGLKIIYQLNPMATVLNGMRWSLLGHGEAPGLIALISIVGVLVVLVGGVFYFRRVERTFADLV
jgi:lipopolysaccharide transport system permease protein